MIDRPQVLSGALSSEVGPSGVRRATASRLRNFASQGGRLLTLTAFLVVGAYLVREPVLQAVADAWIVSDTIRRADAIVVLGGNFHFRPLIAAQLYHSGLADKILVSQTAAPQESSIISDVELNRASLLEQGVPPDAIESFGTANTNTRDEAVALREWAKRNTASVFVIPTEKFTARRVRWIFHRELSGDVGSIVVPSYEAPGYTTRKWWKSEQAVFVFKNELFKYIYYRLKY